MQPRKGRENYGKDTKWQTGNREKCFRTAENYRDEYGKEKEKTKNAGTKNIRA